MLRRPLGIQLLSGYMIVMGSFNLLYVAMSGRYALSAIPLAGILSGIGLLLCKKWGWIGTVIVMGLAVIALIPRILLKEWLFLVPQCIYVVALVYLRQAHIRKLYGFVRT